MLRLDRISKNFGGLQAVNAISMVVEEGESRALIGPNGAGKTTTFNLISGSLLPTAGSIDFLGKSITALPEHRRAALGIGRTYQKTALFEHLTVFENILLSVERKRFGVYSFGRSNNHSRERVDALLRRFELWEKRQLLVSALSYGEQRKVDIVLGLALTPKLLLLDEPSAGLSPGEVEILVSMISSIRQETTILLIEHDMDVVFELSDRITVLHYGSILAEGRPKDIKENPKVREAYLGEERDKDVDD
jgi:branched-chain amino acid transport system ATP-binding protein